MSSANNPEARRLVEVAPVVALPEDLVEAMRATLPEVAERTVAAIIVEVPSYSQALSGTMGQTIENAVRLAFGGLLNLLAGPDGDEPSDPLRAVLDGAYALGRGEARSGRTMDALLAAYRVGARVAWREFVEVTLANGIDAETVAEFAELVFAYIDELSASSVTGHSDELATTGRVRQRYLEQLCHHLLAGSEPEALLAAAERAEWEPPETLTAVLLPQARTREALSKLDQHTLEPGEDATLVGDELSVLLVPDVDGRARPRLLQDLAGLQAVVGPPRPWMEVRSSFDRAVRTQLVAEPTDGPAVDTEDYLVDLVLTADPAALEDLQEATLAPLAQVRDSTAEKLRETLRAWLLHHGRREDIAAALFVHPQTVRYRLNQLRELYGDGLDDPGTILALTVALGRQATSDAAPRTTG